MLKWLKRAREDREIEKDAHFGRNRPTGAAVWRPERGMASKKGAVEWLMVRLMACGNYDERKRVN